MRKLLTSLACILCLGLLTACEDADFFPLDPGLSWRYRVNILPQIEAPELAQLVVANLAPVSLQQDDESPITGIPRLREDGSILYYVDNDRGVRRVASQVRAQSPVSFVAGAEYVLKYPLQEGTRWEVPSKTYLLVRRYPLDQDYRATVDFNIAYRIDSTTDTVSVPAGLFENCLRIRGTGKTNFVGDRGLGRIEVQVETTDWFAPGIGLVKSERVESSSTELFGTTKLSMVLEEFSG